ncbi:MAG TPA: hypothetical protein VNS09_15310 [Solirubrobacter sp.]|nr:hypothetical protein [Solirubrobacter sp.]
MGRVGDYRAELRRLPPERWPAFLAERSGLPGPRGNIELGLAVGEEAGRETLDALLATGDEYLTFCGVIGLGRLAAEGEGGAAVAGGAAVGEAVAGGAVASVAAGGAAVGGAAADARGDALARLHAHAADGRWRVREGVAMALQRLGDADLPRMLAVVRAWAEDADPLVQRAAAAGVCEPRLLRTPAAAAAAVDVCDRATRLLAARPREQRRDDGVRALRKGLGYCWSVAVAADPGPGLPRFEALASVADPDVAWIVRENRKKARLARAYDAARGGAAAAG